MICTNYKLISFKQAVSQIVQTQAKRGVGPAPKVHTEAFKKYV